jgi:hypothetical protein
MASLQRAPAGGSSACRTHPVAGFPKRCRALPRIPALPAGRTIAFVHPDRHHTTARHPYACCAACGSQLIYPVFVRPHSEWQVAITRRCPDCEGIDVVRTSQFAARLWREREAGIRRGLAVAAGIT